MPGTNAQDIVRLASAANPIQAHVWEQALQAEGIECKVVGDFLDAGIGDIPGVSAEVWVHREDFAAAQAILELGKHRSGNEKTDEPEAETSD